MKTLSILISLFTISFTFSQRARLAMNDTIFMHLEGGVFLVLDNKSDSALMLTGTKQSGIISEDEDNKIRWMIGDTTGTYNLPFMMDDTAKSKLPVEMVITTAGTGTGHIDFSTYHTIISNAPYPSMVTCLYLDDCDFGTPLNWHHYFVDRFWVNEPRNYTSRPSIRLRLTYLNSETIAPNLLNPALVRGRRFNDGIGQWAPFESGTPTIGSTTSFVSNIVVPSTDFFAAWAVADASTPLPVELINFEVDCHQREKHIGWQTASEENNDYFIVQKSEDGVQFDFFEKVDGHGNSTSLQTYETIDSDQSPAYYRLKQVDIDGQYSYSKIQYSKGCNESNDGITLFPNPSNGAFKIHMNNNWESMMITITGITGESILQKQFFNQEAVNIELPNISAGVYLVSILVDGKKSLKRWVKY